MIQNKPVILTGLFSLIYMLTCLFVSCKDSTEPYWKLQGKAMGTYYHVTGDQKVDDLQSKLDQLFESFNQSLSTYLPESRISQFNLADSFLVISLDQDSFFLPVLNASQYHHQTTGGAFDPSIQPLINLYGFGSDRKIAGEVSSAVIDSIQAFIGFSKISWRVKDNALTIYKNDPRLELNFNSIAKGQGVDIVAELLEQEGVSSYLVEIGGEVRAKGVSARGTPWVLGVNTPDQASKPNDYLFKISLDDKGLATSGNYRDFIEHEGRTFVHIIDPRDGMNKESELASATIIADLCMDADALATACIVLGLEKSLQLIDELPGVEACFIVLEQDDYAIHMSKKFNQYIYE